MMKAIERQTLEDMKKDIEHDVIQVKSFLADKGGLSLDGFIYRVELKAKGIGEILDGTYPWEKLRSKEERRH